MGIYLTAISFELRYKSTVNIHQSKPVLCNLFGVMSTLSSQVSLTILFIISYYRMIGVIKPYKKQHYKMVTTIVILAWIVWLFVAALPIIPIEPFETGFRIGFMKDFRLGRDTLIDFTYFISIIQTRILPSYNNVSEVTSILHAVTQFPTSSVMEKFSFAMGWVNLKTENWNPVGYYDYQYLCLADFVILNEDYRRFSISFSLVFVISNLIISVAIVISYIVIAVNLYGRVCLNIVHCKFCSFCFSCEKFFDINAVSQSSNNVRSAENRKMFKRISFIVLTDLLCWIPMCISSLVIWHFQNTIEQNLHDTLKVAIPFQTASLVLIPLNSILNPYIYSSNLWKYLFQMIKMKFCAIGTAN